MAWLNLTMPNQTVKNRLKAKRIKLPQINFFLEKQLIKFSCTFWPISFCKILKKFWSRVMRMCHFRDQNSPSVMKNLEIFWKIINIILIYLLAPFIGQNFKKILPAGPELWGWAIFVPKMAHFPKWEFFLENLLMSLGSFIHDYLHIKNQSQILIY